MDLPAPLGPMMARRWPASRMKLRFLNNWVQSVWPGFRLPPPDGAAWLFHRLQSGYTGFGGWRLDFDHLGFDFVCLFQTAGCLAGFGFVGGEAGDELLQLLQFLLCLGVVFQGAFARLGRGEHVVVVVARVDGDGVVVQIRHVGADFV